MTKILTSHVGSLPRTQDVVDFIFAREDGESYDQVAFDNCMSSACNETVRRQVEAGNEQPDHQRNQADRVEMSFNPVFERVHGFLCHGGRIYWGT